MVVWWVLLVYGCQACPRAAASKDGPCSLSPLGISSPQGRLLPTPQERERLKEILSVSAFTYYMYTYLEKYGSLSPGKRSQGNCASCVGCPHMHSPLLC